MKNIIKKPPASLKKKLLIHISIVILLVCVILIGIIFPEIKKIIEIREIITEQQQHIEKEHEQSRKLKETLHELDRGMIIAKKVSEATVNLGEELRIITQLEQMSESLNITQQLSIDQKPVEATSPLRTQGIKEYYLLNVTNSGTFIEMIQFVQGLERLPFFISIDSMNWQVAPQREETSMVSLKFQAKIYIFEQPE